MKKFIFAAATAAVILLIGFGISHSADFKETGSLRNQTGPMVWTELSRFMIIMGSPSSHGRGNSTYPVRRWRPGLMMRMGKG